MNDRNEQIVELRKMGLTMPEIGERFGVSRQYVLQVLQKAGSHDRTYIAPEMAVIRERMIFDLLQLGYGRQEIAGCFKFSLSHADRLIRNSRKMYLKRSGLENMAGWLEGS